MSLTVSSEAAFNYNLSAFLKSDTYTENAVDASTVTKDSFQITDMTEALTTLDEADGVDFSTIGNLSTYVKNLYAGSQTVVAESLRNIQTQTVSYTSLLNNDDDMSSIYGLLYSSSYTKTASYASMLAASYATADSSSYSSETEAASGSTLDVSV